MAPIPLCVPFARKGEARSAGARWDQQQRVWTCAPEHLVSPAYERLRPFVPRMYRPDIEPPYIRPWMVPQTLWGKNLRALLGKEQWDIVRRHAYESAGNRCRVCGGRGPQWPVEADEAWEYDDATHVQTLKGVIALCPDCHHIRHWGKSMVDGREEEVFARLMWINGWSRDTAQAAVDFAFEQWEERSIHAWASDYGWVTRTHGFAPDEEGANRAEEANRDLVEKARREAERYDQWLPSPEHHIGRPSSNVPRDPIPQPRRSGSPSLLGFLRSLLG